MAIGPRHGHCGSGRSQCTPGALRCGGAAAAEVRNVEIRRVGTWGTDDMISGQFHYVVN